MLYNKNSVRKTNDKKILHKVGKQWKVVSVALLMAIGGGAAVAATNNTSANADANQYTMNAQTAATVNSLEANPGQGQSSSAASQSSKAAPSASAKAPTMPSLSLNPDPSLNGYNASAELSRVKQAYDKEVMHFYGSKVSSYVSGVNSKYSASASSVNSNYDKASSTQSNDQSLASSYSATAHQSNWSAEVQQIAHAKSGVGASEFIETVGSTVASYANNLSGIANQMSDASNIASYATLISEINSNQETSLEYWGKSKEAYYTVSLASDNANNADIDAKTKLDASLNNQQVSLAAFANQQSNNAANYAASVNSSADTSMVASLAGSSSGAQYSAMSSAVSAAAMYFDTNDADDQAYKLADANHLNLNGAGANGYKLVDFLNNYKDELNAVDLANKDVASASSDATKYSGSMSQYSADVSAASSALIQSVVTRALSVAVSNASTKVTSADDINNSLETAATNASEAYGNTALYGTLGKKDAYNDISNLALSLYSDGTKSIAYLAKNSAGNIATLATDASKAYDDADNNHHGASSVANSYGATTGYKLSNGNTTYAVSALSGAISAESSYASTESSNASVAISNTASAGNLYQLLSDTAVQQNYGSNSINDSKAISSATAAKSSLAIALSAANSADASASENYNSVKASASVVAILGNHPVLSDVAKIVSAKPNDFYTAATKDFGGTVGTALASMSDPTNVNNASEASVVSEVNSAANALGSSYTSASNSSVAYSKSMDADFVLASSYAVHYEGLSNSDQSAFNAASVARSDFYNTYAGQDYGSAEASLVSAESDEPNQAGLANGYGQYVLKHEPHVVTVAKQLVLHSNPNYNDKTDTPADHKLAVINKGTHLLVTGVGFDKHGNTRLLVNYKGEKGFITGLRNYVNNSYLVPGERYSFTFNRDVKEYNSLQFNKQSYVGTIKKGTTVKGTARLNDDGYHWLGLTRLQLDNSGNYVSTLDTFRTNTVELNDNGQNNAPKAGTYFYNGEDTANPANI